VTFVQPEQEGDMSRIASRLMLAEEFKESGMRVAPPQLVYSSSAGAGRCSTGRRAAASEDARRPAL